MIFLVLFKLDDRVHGLGDIHFVSLAGRHCRNLRCRARFLRHSLVGAGPFARVATRKRVVDESNAGIWVPPGDWQTKVARVLLHYRASLAGLVNKRALRTQFCSGSGCADRCLRSNSPQQTWASFRVSIIREPPHVWAGTAALESVSRWTRWNLPLFTRIR